VLTEMKECAKRIATRVLELAMQTVKSAVNQILALVPDLFFACLEAGSNMGLFSSFPSSQPTPRNVPPPEIRV